MYMSPRYASDLWTQNRFLSALILTGFIMVLLAIVYLAYTRRGILQSARMSQVAKIFRFVLGGTAIAALLASLFPLKSPEAGVLLYAILWPLLALQLVIACLPWERFVQKRPAVTVIAAIIVGCYAFPVVFLMLRLTSYI